MPWGLILLLSLAQFVNILDFMMVVPMGPDLSDALHIDPAKIGMIAGSYTFAASISGFCTSLFIERFPRKFSAVVCMLGLGVATALGAVTWNLESMIAVRLLAGCFGGPSSALALAIAADYVEESMRGRAMAIIMAAFSMASIFGVPFGLELAHRVSWHAPFYGVGALGLIVAVLLWVRLPFRSAPPVSKKIVVLQLLKQRKSWLGLSVGALTMFGAFMVIPNIAVVLQHNLNYPREHLGMLYMMGGVVSLVSMQMVGYLVDRFGGFIVSLFGSVLLSLVTYSVFVVEPVWIPIPLGFSLFMMGMTTRNIVMQATLSKVPAPDQRGSYMALQSSVQHCACSLGAFAASLILYDAADGRIEGMHEVALIATLFFLAMPLLIFRIEKITKSSTPAPP